MASSLSDAARARELYKYVSPRLLERIELTLAELPGIIGLSAPFHQKLQMEA
jgi:hypothetical protein